MSKKAENINFFCENCNQYVKPLTNGSVRNHCPFCLFSKHLDIFPGDRQSECHGMMKPIGVKVSSKKGIQVIHKCLVCENEQLNKIATETEQEDNINLVYKLMKEGNKLLI